MKKALRYFFLGIPALILIALGLLLQWLFPVAGILCVFGSWMLTGKKPEFQ